MPETAGRVRSALLAVPAGVRRDYAVSTAVQWFTLGVGLVLFHLVARRGSVGGFAYYQIARGSVATVQPLAMAGLGAGLQRYLPRSGDRAPALARRGFAVELAVAAAFAAAGLALAGPLSRLLGLTGGTWAVGGVGALLAGTCLCATAVAGLRGTGQVAHANAVWLAGMAVSPALAFLLAARLKAPLELFLILQGAGMTAVAVGGVAATRRPAGDSPGGPDGSGRSAGPDGSGGPQGSGGPDGSGGPRGSSGPDGSSGPQGSSGPGGPGGVLALVRYGLRRTPGDLALPALFAFPTFAVAAARPGAPDAGFVGFASSAVTLVCSLFGMLTPVLLPRLSGHFHNPGGGASLHRGLLALPLVAAGLAALIALLISLPAPALIRGFLGAGFAGAEPVLRLGLAAAVPLAMFYAVRPTLDALQDVPVTTRLLVGSLAVEVVLTYALRLALNPPAAAVLAFGLAAAALAAASYLALTRAMAARAV